MTLAGGALFGVVTGTILVSFASSIGATLAFLASRFLLRDWVRRAIGDGMKALNDGVAKEGAFYLFALRLVPLFPFWLINLAMGLTSIRTWTFYWVSQLGMLAGTVVYVYAGTQLGQFRHLGRADLRLRAARASFPLVAKKVLDAIKARKVYARWEQRARALRLQHGRDRRRQRGLVSAYIAAATKAKVALVEKHRMGGDCLNTGCVPSKALIRSAKLLSHIARSKQFGIAQASAPLRLRRGDAARAAGREDHRAARLGRAVHGAWRRGDRRLGDDHLAVDGARCRRRAGPRTLTTKNIVIAAGARPFVPPIPGLADVGYLTSDTLWNLRTLPKRLVVLGGGPIGCELAQAFARLGSQVTQVEMLPRLLIREDPDVSVLVQARFEAEGVARAGRPSRRRSSWSRTARRC